MKVHNDMRYINNELIKRGLMKTVPYSIRLDRYFTEEQKKTNTAYAENHIGEEWDARCEETRKRIAAENLKLMEHLKPLFKIGQYDDSIGYDDCDLWFWCNDLYNTTNGREQGRDYSYITLTFIDRNNYDVNERLCKQIKKILEDYPANNIQAIFQYSQIELSDKVEREAERIFNDCAGKFVIYNGCLTGRLEKYNGNYIFKKKNAKKHAYRLKPIDICSGIGGSKL